MKKQDSRITRTYALLTKALNELLKEELFDNLTVSEICEKAGVHRATFYKHFEDKYAFLKFYFQYQLEKIDFTQVSRSDNKILLKDRCTYLLDYVYNFVSENKLIFNAFTDNRTSLAFSTTITDALAAFISTRIGAYCSVVDYKVDMLANFYAYSIVGLYKWYFTNETECTREDLRKFYERKVEEMFRYYTEYLF